MLCENTVTLDFTLKVWVSTIHFSLDCYPHLLSPLPELVFCSCIKWPDMFRIRPTWYSFTLMLNYGPPLTCGLHPNLGLQQRWQSRKPRRPCDLTICSWPTELSNKSAVDFRNGRLVLHVLSKIGMNICLKQKLNNYLLQSFQFLNINGN